MTLVEPTLKSHLIKAIANHDVAANLEVLFTKNFTDSRSHQLVNINVHVLNSENDLLLLKISPIENLPPVSVEIPKTVKPILRVR